MKYTTLLIVFIFSLAFNAYAEEQKLADFLRSFDYDTRIEMKAGVRELVDLLHEGKAQLIDIRFHEEYKAWHMGVGTNIPLDELPNRLDELDKNKIIVTACPHKDRAIIAMTYLRTKGYETMYLKDGLIGLAEFLRGDNAKDFIEQTFK
ncbi:MAG: rhodanese-like domain-containing protein [Gammaproteobacteria bacterium]|nr:rhodanese-like domain-containing protein [Gammaproteobacteria bacterium]